MGSHATQLPILIIGAGISGLTLAQACRKYDVPYQLFERDVSPTARSAGWGLTLNWSLPTFRSLVPDDVLARLPETLVNKAAVDAGEKGRFTFFDLDTGTAKWKVPATERIRVSRERLRRLLLTGLDVHWGKALSAVRKVENGVTATFSDGSEATGCLLVGCDGANSQTRKLCHPEDCRNKQLPIRFIGAGVRYPRSEIDGMYKLDQFFLQGSHPSTDAFMWFSFLDVPGDPHTVTHDVEGENEVDMYRCQIMTSWPYRAAFLGHDAPIEMPDGKEEKLALMKRVASDFTEPFRGVVQNIPPASEVKEVYLADWLPRASSTTALGRELGGRVVLVGDAAHAMVMYRGEGANHSIVDVGHLVDLLRPLVKDSTSDEQWQQVVHHYEEEMIERTAVAVLASRQACMDAHDYKRLNDNSPLVRRRLMRSDLEETEAAR
ncbi:hypothetical protein LTR86_009079 [Recurvomyces mirabilis]|nr:hypothetical protein LTR86_009079 [Recurvomyces mirabilis]